MEVKITVTGANGRESYIVPAATWEAEVTRHEADASVRQIVARQVEPMVHYAYNRAESAHSTFCLCPECDWQDGEERRARLSA